MSSLQIAIIIVFFLTLFVIFWIWMSVVYWTLKNGISPMPTTSKTKNKVLSTIPPGTQGTVVELGSGWGNMAMQIARFLPHCQVIGYENSPIPYYFSRIWNMMEKQPNLKYYRKDFFDVSLKGVDLVYCYLYPEAMSRLVKKFDEELKSGTVVISNSFALPRWDPVQILNVVDTYHLRIYIYMKSSSNVDALHAKPISINKESSDGPLKENIGVSG